MRRPLAFAALLAAVLTVPAAPAGAAVSFDPGTGEGFAARGDVAAAFGWNAGQYTSRAAAVAFTYRSSHTWTVTCTFDEPFDGQKPRVGTWDGVASTESEVLSAVRRARAHTPATGHDLTGYGWTVVGDPPPIPAVGEPCEAADGTGPFSGTTTSVVESSLGPALFAHHCGRSVPLT
jgi:hypothetical protein